MSSARVKLYGGPYDGDDVTIRLPLPQGISLPTKGSPPEYVRGRALCIDAEVTSPSPTTTVTYRFERRGIRDQQPIYVFEGHA